jgi:chemotaxis protein histidine kinase CheA
VAPQRQVLEGLRPAPHDLVVLGNGVALAWRGAFVPCVDAGRELGASPRGAGAPAGTARCMAIVTAVGDPGRERQVAVLVDDIRTTIEAMTQPVSADFGGGAAAVTSFVLLGDGAVAPVVDLHILASAEAA